MRPRPPSERDFTSFLRSPAVASRVGLALGICFGLAFLTGLYSHWQQNPDAWFPPPTRPVWGYRLTQGLHVASGTAAIPLLLVKLWTVYPKLFAALPDLRKPRAALLNALERGSIAVLVASGIFMLATGIANSAQWYPWSFTFRLTHYALAWVAIGALVVHIMVKLPLIRGALGADIDSTENDRPGTAHRASGMTRRGLVGTAYAAAAVAVLSTAGATVPLLRKVSVFGVRSGDGPGGIPINRSARAARVTALATAGDYTLVVANGDREVEVDLDRLTSMRRHTYDLPIACVEGWSAQGTWAGPRIRDLMALVDAPEGADVVVRSLQPSGPYTTTLLPGNFAAADNTLLATHLSGERLSIDHGFPCRVIAPNRPGVLQTKWVARLEVRT
ncbi:molybdopterin-binding protein [Marmoricola endophyticus]|uniref:Molybdopterin-binding protein n=1 Tax=Marmoricola endophyticus TaxID=2040280 RepID=A0A917BBQ6_9ACTN|nr:molybdopterin-dependent oxidoreductase [Marmoricola endophyticus]GGF30726.1 molybdopterin-binding protein [Marmoricola endophyticus]